MPPAPSSRISQIASGADALSARRTGRPSASEADALNQEILSAALREFLDRGFSGASIARIAKGANVARMAIYRRYGGKQALFETVLFEQIRQLEALASAIRNDAGDPLTELRMTARAYLEFMISPTAVDLQRILIAEGSRLSTLSQQVAPPLPQLLGERLDQLIGHAQQAGQLIEMPGALLREILLRLIAEGPRWEMLMGQKAWTADDIEQHFQKMWPMFLKIAAV
ncbi:hypothetical protein ATN00_09935 [Sphingobium baderi]|uniref:HTH tetR-type domain-containing protein n=2 Tax=Sphingobium baderi TaxID=1332080 RepID=A0A0S3EYS1_9SPHN|nr:hypothetical protein ATN00_09935 [Sphingobium baderi]